MCVVWHCCGCDVVKQTKRRKNKKITCHVADYNSQGTQLSRLISRLISRLSRLSRTSSWSRVGSSVFSCNLVTHWANTDCNPTR
mmetsp:Transcript_13590/g.40995  ORF Transcript_13590/g.40995 Transcript_13590/m.40995 type:complete len:84 (-) Transcript_13590:359-610(-)